MNDWTIEQIGDLYHIRRTEGSGPKLTPATKAQLSRALQPHGIVGSLYEEVCRQLEDTGKAGVSVTMVKLRQF
jgi:hypothetical protein